MYLLYGLEGKETGKGFIKMIEDIINTLIILGFIFGGFMMGYWYRGFKEKQDYEPF